MGAERTATSVRGQASSEENQISRVQRRDCKDGGEGSSTETRGVLAGLTLATAWRTAVTTGVTAAAAPAVLYCNSGIGA